MNASFRSNATCSTEIVTRPEGVRRACNGETSVICVRGDEVALHALELEANLRQASPPRVISGLAYAVATQFAPRRPCSHVMDVYPFSNGDVALSVVQIGGMGSPSASVAAAQVTLLKYGLRAYASYGLMPESVVRNVDRLFLESGSFERREAFANVFFGVLDESRRYLTYACAAHESIVVVHSDGRSDELAVTAPLIGVFDDQHHLFRQGTIKVAAGSLIVATTHEVVTARDVRGDQFGVQRLRETVARHRGESERAIANQVLAAVDGFAHAEQRADRGVLVARVRSRSVSDSS